MRNVAKSLLASSIFCAAILCVGCLGQSQPSPSAESKITRSAPQKTITPAIPANAVNESPRQIPVAYDVDVLVVGGSSAGVAAAAAAANSGATVFLAAQRPYLGQDLCGTYRLWLEDGELPESEFENQLFAESRGGALIAKSVSFKYDADKPSSSVHKDTQPPSVLADGKYQSASSQSVQYDGDVEIIADLGSAKKLKNVYVMTYQRRSTALEGDFEVDTITVSSSDDKQQWSQIAVIANPQKGQSLPEPWGPVEFSAAVQANTRYLKFSVKKNNDVGRILLGEIVIEDDSPAPAAAPRRMPPTPMQVKRTLDNTLLDAGVKFLYGCYATDVLTDADGRIAGIVMANRAGRQAVKAKVIIDATPRATVTAMAGLADAEYPSAPQKFERTIVGGKPLEGLNAQTMPTPLPVTSANMSEAVRYTLDIPMKDDSWASFADAEQLARDITFSKDQGEGAEVLFQVPPDPIKAQKTLKGDFPGAAKVDIAAFRPQGVARLLILGGRADVSRKAAAKLLRPLEFVRLGSRIGAEAAREARSIDKLTGVRLRGKSTTPVASGTVAENLNGIRDRHVELGMVESDGHALAVLGTYDVVVIGGGTGGAPAAISAARQGAKTLLVEYLNGLGGVGTMGLISKYYYGYIEGFTAEVNQGVSDLGGLAQVQRTAWKPLWKSEWYRKELRKAGADVWYRSLGCGAFVADGKVRGAIVATPHGRGVVLAKVVIDSTGNSDIAAVAGADTTYTDENSVAVPGTGLPPWKVDTGYTNTDWTFVDDSDPIDAWRSYVTAKSKYTEAYDLGQLIDTRERRRIVGDFTISPMDISIGRTYPDTVVMSRSNFDTHGYTIHPIFLLRPPNKETMLVGVPYRSLLPKGLDGILVTGLSVSAHRDAMPVIRMQADVQNQGYAAGAAAAMASRTGEELRRIDIKALQGHLVDKGNLPETVLTDTDSMPMPREKIADAVQRAGDNFDGLDIVLAQPRDSMPMLRNAYADAETSKAKLAYAHILAMLGDDTGAAEILDAVKATPWDKGWNYTGMGQFGASISALDSLIIALGRTGADSAVDLIAERAAQLTPTSEFSHCRAVAMAFEALNDPSAAPAIAELLKKPGMTGHAFTEIEDAKARTPASAVDTTTRNNSLKELILARALYRCGDHEALGEKILKQYAKDLRAHYARHARGVLDEKMKQQ